MYKKVLCYLLGLILAGLALATWALAQPAGRFQPPPGGGYQQQPGGPAGAGFEGQFQSIKRTQMGPMLGVSQQTVDQLLQIEARYQSRRQQLIQDSKADFQRLRQLMDQPAPSDQEVKAVLTDIKQKKREMEELQSRQGAEEEALLTPVQQARYIIYLKGLLKEARSVKGRGQPGETMPYGGPTPREIPVSRPPR